MHPRLLKTFLAVARTGNVTRAADEVHLAQSSVSGQIQSLETELGTHLFTRSNLGLELTPAGEILKSYVDEILALVDEARAAVQASAKQMAGSITIGALETIAAAKLPQWLSDLRYSHSGLVPRLKVAGTGELLRKLKDGELDVIFCFDRGDFDESLIKRKVSTEPLAIIASPADASSIAAGDMKRLCGMGFVTTETGCIYRHLFEEAFSNAGLPSPKIVAEVGSMRAIGRMVAAGAGLGLVPRLAVAEALVRGEIVEIPWPVPLGAAQLVMVWRRRRAQPPVLKPLLAAARGELVPVKSTGVHRRHAISSLS